jgi:cobalt-zinc-cadmium efflux system outer membrane protein
VSKRLDLAAFRAQLTNAAAALSLQTKTRFMPTTVDVGIDTEKESDGQRVTGPTLDLELPIFDQGQAAIAKLRAQYRQAQQSFRALAIDVRSEVREARDRLIANRDLAEYYRSILLPLRIKIVNQTMLQYNAMQIGPADLLLSKERELETERAYVEAWRDYWIARADLEKAVGGNVRPPPESVPPVSIENSNNLNPNHPH